MTPLRRRMLEDMQTEPCFDHQLVGVFFEGPAVKSPSNLNRLETSLLQQAPKVRWIEVRKLESVHRCPGEDTVRSVLLVTVL